MIIVGHGSSSNGVEFIFEGEDRDSLIETAIANGCVEWVETDQRPAAGSRMVDGVILPPGSDEIALAARAAMTITPRQLFIALATPPWSYITPDEAVAAAMTGAMPASVEAAIADFDPAVQLAARITWARMQVVLRLDPLVVALGASQGSSDAELDDFFTFAAGL